MITFLWEKHTLRSAGVPKCTVAREAEQSSSDADIREPCYEPLNCGQHFLVGQSTEVLLSACLGIYVHGGNSYNPGKESRSLP